MALTWTAETLRPRRAGAQTRLALLSRAVEHRPEMGRLHYDLAIAHAQVEDFASCVASFERGLALQPPEPSGLVPYLNALIALGRQDAALEFLASRADDVSAAPGLLCCRGAARAAQGDAAAAARDLREALRIAPRHHEAVRHLVPLLTRAKDWTGLLDLVEEQRAAGPLTGTLVRALLSGLVGLGRVEEAAPWVDFDAVVSVTDVAPPVPYADRAAFHAALAADLRSPHKMRLHDVPRLVMSGGVQVEDLEVDSSPATTALFEAFRDAVERYVAEAVGARRAMLDEMLRPPLSMSAWALMLGADDTQDRHYHLYATLGGVYYVDAPAETLAEGSTAGCLVIPCEDALGDARGERFLAPRPGRLVLFPGYLHHRTTPTGVSGTRISVAFNVISTSS